MVTRFIPAKTTHTRTQRLNISMQYWFQRQKEPDACKYSISRAKVNSKSSPSELMPYNAICSFILCFARICASIRIRSFISRISIDCNGVENLHRAKVNKKPDKATQIKFTWRTQECSNSFFNALKDYSPLESNLNPISKRDHMVCRIRLPAALQKFESNEQCHSIASSVPNVPVLQCTIYENCRVRRFSPC